MYLIEGNVGVGKSTLLALIHEHLKHVHVVFEKVDSWDKNEQGASLLSHFYKDTPRWSYTMETYTMFTRVKEHLHEQSQNNSFKVIERSLFSGHYCFAKNGYQQGYMDVIEWQLYTDWFNFLVNQHCKAPYGFIYLQADPLTCKERTEKRNRSSEAGIPLTYFEQIHEKHEAFLIKKQNVAPLIKDVPVLVLDATYDFQSDKETLTDYLDKINTFIQVTQR